jgi:hypothetical protein
MSLTASWPPLDYEALAPTLDHLHRLAQVGGKHTVDTPFEPNWGNVPLNITPRGFATPTVQAGDVAFLVDYDLLDHRVELVASTGRRTLELGPGSVANFLERFTEASSALRVPALSNLSEPELTDAPTLDADVEQRPYDREAATMIAGGLRCAWSALNLYQAPFRGHRHRVGLMWGGFDISAQRFNGRSVQPPATPPVFLQNGMTGEVVSVGFSFGDPQSRTPAFYAYISPPAAGLPEADLGADGAIWNEDAGMALLPWQALLRVDDPQDAVVRFGDAVYAQAGWAAELVGERVGGREAAIRPLFA